MRVLRLMLAVISLPLNSAAAQQLPFTTLTEAETLHYRMFVDSVYKDMDTYFSQIQVEPFVSFRGQIRFEMEERGSVLVSVTKTGEEYDIKLPLGAVLTAVNFTVLGNNMGKIADINDVRCVKDYG